MAEANFRSVSGFAGLFLLTIYLILSVPASAQQPFGAVSEKESSLALFAKKRGAEWKEEKEKADSLALLLNLPIFYIDKNERVVILQRLGRKDRPVYYATDNIDAAITISADQVWTDETGAPFLSGEGIEINLWDGGSVLTDHQEFQNEAGNRIIMRNQDVALSNHSTHIAGTMAACGMDEDARGMADMAVVYGWDINNDIAEMSIVASEGALVSNHSYGSLCGWYLNNQTGTWYWYGDPEISETEDYQFGYYDQVSADIDFIAWNAPAYLVVKSAGNDRNDSPPSQPVSHFIWDETWVNINDVVRDADGGQYGYDCLTPMSVAKNSITVGAVDDERAITLFSAFGPTDDGRIKPDVTANGKDVYSSVSTSIRSYGYFDGTSMATASVTGSIALLHQLFQWLQPGYKPLSSTIKGLLIHSADEAGNNPGPDYRFGWGIVNVRSAADLILASSANGGKNILEGRLTDGEEIVIPVETTVTSGSLKVTLCWTDPPGEVDQPSLNRRDPKLVNDIDLVVENCGSLNRYYPWLLDAENPSLAASKGVNHVDNVEQVYILNPGDSLYNIIISNSSVLNGGYQHFSLIISGNAARSGIMPPADLQFRVFPGTVELTWSGPGLSEPDFYRVYRNNSLLDETTSTEFTDMEVISGSVYDYYITAVYNIEGHEFESIPTNKITAVPRQLSALPYIVDLEEGPASLLIKNDFDGWRWGNSEFLGSFYVNFEKNTTSFIGTNSNTAGETSHVNDIATTPPLKMEDYTDITISFRYMLVTGLYNSVDELHLLYKQQEETVWNELVKLPAAFSWSSVTYNIPPEACKNGTQFGFYYDDFYQWGMGAGIDDIQITGTAVRSIDLEINSMISPVSDCSVAADEPVTLAIKNSGEHEALPGDMVDIRMDVSTGFSVTDEIVLVSPLLPGEILVHQMSSSPDLSAPGVYTINFTILSVADNEDSNNLLEAEIETYGYPDVMILCEDTLFCENEEALLVEVSPEGGLLTGNGLSGFTFDPSEAGVGTHLISYSYTDQYGCSNADEINFVVVPNPAISLGPDQYVYLGETIEIEPVTDGDSFLWFDDSTADSLLVITGEWGAGIYDIWAKAYNTDNCSSVDSMILTIDFTTFSEKREQGLAASVYPNPFSQGFYIRLENGEIPLKISVYRQGGQLVYAGSIPEYPYFDGSFLQPGNYIMVIETGRRRIVLFAIKI